MVTSVRTRVLRLLVCGALSGTIAGVSALEQLQSTQGMHAPLTEILDINVRDGLVYYRALKGARGRLDSYVRSLDVPAATVGQWSRGDQIAYWVNAYNAFVLQTVIDRYPIRGASPDYPVNSIRQIPGAFERLPHRAGGRSVTLDEIEKVILPAFGDPRILMVLGRGAVGSTRLRSEALNGAELESQLASAAEEFASRQRHVKVDTSAGVIAVSPIVSWHEKEFVAAYAKGTGGDAGARYSARSPVERAIVTFMEPYLLPLEREFVQKNDFRVMFQTFDWRLNDLTGGRVD